MGHDVINTDKGRYILCSLFIITSEHNYVDTECMEIFYCFNRFSFYLVGYHHKSKNLFFGGKNDWRLTLSSKLVKFCCIKRHPQVMHKFCITDKVFRASN